MAAVFQFFYSSLIFKITFPALLAGLLLSSSVLQASVIEFSVDELAAETVLPVFDNSVSVRNRLVTKTGRFEVGLSGGLSLNEPFYGPSHFALHGAYHLSEVHGLQLSHTQWLGGLSTYGEQLSIGGPGGSPAPFDPSLAPQVEGLTTLNYQASLFYGKISLSKQLVMNLSIYGLAGFGAVGLSRGAGSKLAAHAAVGQNIFITPDLAFKFDIRLFSYRGPDPTTQVLNPSDPAPDPSTFGEDLYFNTLINFGLVYLL